MQITISLSFLIILKLMTKIYVMKLEVIFGRSRSKKQIWNHCLKSAFDSKQNQTTLSHIQDFQEHFRLKHWKYVVEKKENFESPVLHCKLL